MILILNVHLFDVYSSSSIASNIFGNSGYRFVNAAPSTKRVSPDTHDASSDARNKAAFAISSGLPALPRGIFSSSQSICKQGGKAKYQKPLRLDRLNVCYPLWTDKNCQIPAGKGRQSNFKKLSGKTRMSFKI